MRGDSDDNEERTEDNRDKGRLMREHLSAYLLGFENQSDEEMYHEFYEELKYPQ